MDEVADGLFVGPADDWGDNLLVECLKYSQ